MGGNGMALAKLALSYQLLTLLLLGTLPWSQAIVFVPKIAPVLILRKVGIPRSVIETLGREAQHATGLAQRPSLPGYLTSAFFPKGPIRGRTPQSGRQERTCSRKPGIQTNDLWVELTNKNRIISSRKLESTFLPADTS
ncbi:hypothetical protein Y1Q_0006934 [Alligator mississippiensis]|uniref:Uncharacterized protein n=1 Tax=Alligator mississippiensis TaxID=8496 RepID=A0A151MUQ3_ALLMI|nr:hypothetical protein Y1Q_0006934 [Alligator mississippiensis]